MSCINFRSIDICILKADKQEGVTKILPGYTVTHGDRPGQNGSLCDLMPAQVRGNYAAYRGT